MARREDRYYPRLSNMCKNSPKKLRLERKQTGGNEGKVTQRKNFLDEIGKIFFLKLRGMSRDAKTISPVFKNRCND